MIAGGFQCTKCHRRFVRQGDLTKHVRTHRKVFSGNQQQHPFQCKFCQKGFTHALFRLLHENTEHVSKWFHHSGQYFADYDDLLNENGGQRQVQKCSICQLPFHTYQQWLEHRRNVHHLVTPKKNPVTRKRRRALRKKITSNNLPKSPPKEIEVIVIESSDEEAASTLVLDNHRNLSNDVSNTTEIEKNGPVEIKQDKVESEGVEDSHNEFKRPSRDSVIVFNIAAHIEGAKVQISPKRNYSESPKLNGLSPHKLNNLNIPELNELDSPKLADLAEHKPNDLEMPKLDALESPESNDLASPGLNDLESPELNDVGSPIPSDLESPIHSDLESPVLSDVESPVLSDVESPEPNDVSPPKLKDLSLPKLNDLESLDLDDLSPPNLDNFEPPNRNHLIPPRTYPGKIKRRGKKLAFKDIKARQKKNSSTWPYQCPLCPQSCFRQASLDYHMRSHSGDNTGEMPFACRYCWKSFSFRSSLLRHERLHSGARIFLCKVCDKRFTSRANLASHKRTHRDGTEEKFRCDDCGKHFLWKSSLRLHRRLHTEDVVTCVMCLKQFTDTGRLYCHLMTHTGERPYSCKICQRGFIKNIRRREHERSHVTVESPLQCDSCQEVFHSKVALAKHKLEDHVSNNARFSCDICHKLYSYKKSLDKHVRIHTGEKPFKCVQCDMAFVTPWRLHNHVTRKHE